jgi:hypothetical protein
VLKWFNKCVYRTVVLALCPAKNSIFAPFIYKNDRFVSKRKTAFLRQTIVLPRQARDKHRENSKTDAVFRTMRRLRARPRESCCRHRLAGTIQEKTNARSAPPSLNLFVSVQLPTNSRDLLRQAQDNRKEGQVRRNAAAVSSLAPSFACVVFIYTPPKEAFPDIAGGRWPPARPQLSNTGAEPLRTRGGNTQRSARE